MGFYKAAGLRPEVYAVCGLGVVPQQADLEEIVFREVGEAKAQVSVMPRVGIGDVLIELNTKVSKVCDGFLLCCKF